jgi:hypothetical protein
MGELNVDDLPDLNEANAFNVDDLPDLKKKEVSQPAAQPIGQTSKSGTSNISQSNYNLDLSLPTVNPNPNNVALPGLGQPFKSNKDVLGKGTPIDNTPKKESIQNPYAVDITDKSKDNTKTQTVRQAQIQNDIDTGILEAKNPTTYIGASIDYASKAKEVTGKDDAQALLDYGKVIGVDDDLFGRLPDGDKQVYQNNQQLQDLYKQRDILGNSDDQTKDSHLKDVNKSIAEIEKANAQLFQQRNSQIDADILDMQKQLNSGTKTIQQSTGSGEMFGPEKMDMAPQVTQTLPMTDEDKSQLKSQIAQLQKKKGDFLAGAHTPEQVFKDFQPQIKMYEDKNIIPKDATAIDKLKIYYGVKLKQLQSLKQKSEKEGEIFTSSQDGVLSNIAEGVGDAFGALAQSSSGIAGQSAGYENPIRQRLIDDKTTKSIKEIEGQLSAIAPIIAINRNPNDKKNSFGTAFKNKFVDELSQTTKNNTSQENAIQIQNTLKDTGLELSEDRTKEIEKQAKAKDNGQFSENIGSELGGMTELMMELGATTAVLPFAGAEATLTKIAPKGRALLGMAGEVMKDTKLGKLAYDATIEGAKLAAVGKVNERLKDVGTFTNGAAFSVGGKLGGVLEKQLIGLFGEQLPEAVKLATAIAGKTISESTKMAGADLVNMYGESKSGKEFLQSVKDKYGDLDHDLSFGIQMVALATVFSGSEIGNTLSHYVKKFRNDLSSTDAEKFDAITHDLKDEVHTATDNVIQQSSNIGEAAAKENSSTITKVETDIANKISKGEKLTNEEQDYYDVAKEDIDKLVAGSVSSSKTNVNPLKDVESTTTALNDDLVLKIEEKANILFPKSEQTNEIISEAYHKAKADGSNPELVEAVEDLLQKNKSTISKEQTEPTKKLAEGVSSNSNEGVNPALKDVEATAKALEGVNLTTKIPIQQINELNKQLYNNLFDKQKELLAKGERDFDNNEEIKSIKEQIAFSEALIKNDTKAISEAYHKAKEDGSNPELVKAVEEALQQTKQPAETKVTVSKAVIEIGGKMYEGNNHAEAILKAKADGQDISQVDRQAQGKFKLSDGTIIDRAESKSRFGQDRSELIIPQDEAAKAADKEYAELIKDTKNESTSTTNIDTEQKVDNSSGISTAQPNNKELGTGNATKPVKENTQELQQQEGQSQVEQNLADKKQIIAELESNPNSPFHKLVDLDALKKEVESMEQVSHETDVPQVDTKKNEVLSNSDVKENLTTEKIVPPTDIKQKKAGSDKSVEKTILKKRVYDNENSKEEFKRELSKYGLNRDKIPHAEAKSIANNIIAEHGIDNAMDAVRNGDIKNGVAAEIYYAKFKQLDTQVGEAKTDEEKTALIGQKAKLVSDWSNAGTDAGQFNSQLANIYKEDDGLLFNAEIQKEEYKSLNGGTISPEMEKKFDDLSNQLEENKKIIDDLNSKQTEIEEKYKDAVSQKDVDAAIKDAYEKGKKDGTKDSQSKKYTKRFNEIADNFERKFKSKPLTLKDADGNEIQLIQNSIVSWNDIVKVGSEAIRKTGQIADGVSAIIDHIKDQEWYKDLSPKSRDAVKTQFTDYFKDSKKDDGFNISGKTVKDIILRRKSENENTTIEDVVEEINIDFPDKTPREIRDAISGYGKVKEATGGIDAEVRKIKRMGRYISALEDIENGIRPSKSGQQREAPEADERAELKKIREGLKKLPLSDEDLNNKLKSTQDAIVSRLKNKIEDLERQKQTGEKSIRNSKVETTPEIEKLKDQVQKLKDDLSEIESVNRHQDTLQEIQDIADKTGQKTITKSETKNGLISDLVQAHIEKGTSMESIQKEMFDELKQILPDITERQLRDAITKKGEFKTQSKEATDLQNQLSELKKQLSHQSKIEDIQAGIVAEQNKSGLTNTDKAKQMRKELSDAKKEALNKYPEVSAKELQKKINSTQRSIDEYKRKIAEKEFSKQKSVQAEFHGDKDWRKNYKELEAKKLEREKIKAEFEREKDKAADKHRTNTEKIGEFLGKLKRFDIFLDIFGMGRLALAAVFRPAFLPLRETSKYLLSRVATETMKKSPGNYRSSIGQSLRYVSDYYASYFAKKTYKDAWSEFDKRSNFSLEHDAQNGKDRYSTLAGKILAAPEQAHGFMKAFAKLPQFNATYKAALENLNQTIDPQTGEVYDINDPAVQQMAVHEAKREANADVLMADSDLARLNSALWTGAMKSDNYIVQLTGIIGKQLEPVIKVPINFYHEVLDQIPLVGLADAISTIARSGDIKEKQTGGYRGVKNLTHDQAHDVQRKLTNQLVGVMGIGIGMGLYKLLKEKSEDDLKEVEKWMHNSSFPIVMMGMELAKDLEHKNYDKISDIPADVIKKQTQHLPQYKVMKDIVFANDKTFKKLLAALVTPAFLRKWALMQDNEKKRYPKSIQDYIAVNFPQIKIGGKVIIEGRQGVSTQKK